MEGVAVVKSGGRVVVLPTKRVLGKTSANAPRGMPAIIKSEVAAYLP